MWDPTWSSPPLFTPPLPRLRPDLAETSHRQQQREAGPVGGRTDSLRAAGAAELHVQGNQPGRCGVVPAGSFVSPAAEPMRRLLASDGGSDLRYVCIISGYVCC